MSIKTALLLAGLLTAMPVFAEVDLSKLPPPAKKQGVTYEHDIRPLFEASCVNCHGAQRPKAGLRLDSLDAVLKGSRDNKVVTPGHSEKSPLVIAISRLDDETAMPPKRQGRGGNRPPNTGADGTNQPPGGAPPRGPQGAPPKPLTPEQVGLVRAWIDQGAK